MTKHKKHMPDERVQQESDGILAKNFRMAMLLLTALLVVKAACLLAGLPWYVLLPEAAGLLTGGAICAAWMSLRGLWGPADERIASERAKCLSTAWTAAHCVALLASTALLLLDRDHSMLYMLTMLAMTLIQYLTLGRMTRSGLYSGRRQRLDATDTGHGSGADHRTGADGLAGQTAAADVLCVGVRCAGGHSAGVMSAGRRSGTGDDEAERAQGAGTARTGGGHG